MKKILAIVSILFMTGCASTKMTSYVDPAFANTTYKSLLVSSNIIDLEQKGYLETVVCNEIAVFGTDCQRAIDIFPPTRKYTDKQWIEKFISSGAEALIIVDLTDSYSTQTYVPPTTTTSGNVTAYGNTAYYNQTTNTSGGYNINKPVENYKITVVDGSNGQTVMIATSRTGGNAFAKSSHMSKSLAAGLVNELLSKGLISRQTTNK